MYAYYAYLFDKRKALRNSIRSSEWVYNKIIMCGQSYLATSVSFSLLCVPYITFHYRDTTYFFLQFISSVLGMYAYCHLTISISEFFFTDILVKLYARVYWVFYFPSNNLKYSFLFFSFYNEWRKKKKK